jgi:putative transcriptional regulator
MSKKELAEKSNISVTSISKLKNGANVNTEILLKICISLDCDISDIVEVVKE